MSSSTLYKLSGGALMIGGLLAAIGSLLEAFVTDPLSPLWLLAVVPLFIGALFVLVGLPALYIRQVVKMGTLGLVGFVLLFVGQAIVGIGGGVVDLVALPWLATVGPHLLNSAPPPAGIVYFLAGIVLLLLGSIMFGIATLRAGILPRGAVILLLVSLALNFLKAIPYLGSLSLVVFYVAFIWFGYALVASSRTVQETQPASAPGEKEEATASSS